MLLNQPHNTLTHFSAFLVAWGTMASELAKVIALSVIGLELRQLGVNKKELLAFWMSIAVIIGMQFSIGCKEGPDHC